MNPDMRKSGPISELQRTVSEEGIKALWKGVGPAMARAALLTASQLATYDETKQVKLSMCIFVFLVLFPLHFCLHCHLFHFVIMQILVRWTSLQEGFPLHLMYDTAANFDSSLHLF